MWSSACDRFGLRSVILVSAGVLNDLMSLIQTVGKWNSGVGPKTQSLFGNSIHLQSFAARFAMFLTHPGQGGAILRGQDAAQAIFAEVKAKFEANPHEKKSLLNPFRKYQWLLNESQAEWVVLNCDRHISTLQTSDGKEVSSTFAQLSLVWQLT